MTIVKLMEDVADYLRESLKSHYTIDKKGATPFIVCAGYPVQRESNTKLPPLVSVVATHFTKDSATLQIDVNMEAADAKDGSMQLFNVLEHIRQALLMRRTIARKHIIKAETLKGGVVEEQRYPQWQGFITVEYSIAEPEEEFINYGN